MAKSLEITTSKNAIKVVVDGNKIDDVISYELIENINEGTVLRLKIAIIIGCAQVHPLQAETPARASTGDWPPGADEAGRYLKPPIRGGRKEFKR